MERELVSDRGGLTAAQFTQDSVIANITPVLSHDVGDTRLIGGWSSQAVWGRA